MPLPLTVSCSSKIQIGFTFLVPAHPGCPGKEAVKWLLLLLLLVDRHGTGQARRQEIKWRGKFFFVKQWTFPQRRMHYVQYQREMVIKVPITMCSHVVHLVWFVHHVSTKRRPLFSY